MTSVDPKDRSRTAGRNGEKKRAWMTSFIPRRLEFYFSPSWKLAPRPLKNMLERLEEEHLRHGGYKNGELFVGYSAFVDHGISRKSIKRVLALGSDLGLIEVVYSDDAGSGDVRPPNAYRLTYVPAKGKDNPTDEWKTVTKERAEHLVAVFKSTEKAAVKATRKAAA
jgi:hypothetical protein